MNLRLDAELWWRRHGGLMTGVVAVASICILAVMARVAVEVRMPAEVSVAAEDMPRPDANLRAFRARLLTRQGLEAGQQTLLENARRHGLVIRRIDYGFEWRDAGRFGIASLQLPLSGGYADFQRFLSAALAAEPALGAEDLVIRRSSDGHGVEARVRFILFTADRQGAPS